MILWTTSETPSGWEPREGRLWRWEARLSDWHAGLERQFLNAGSDEWRLGWNYYKIGVSPRPERWHVGMHHDYYDQPHHVLWVGPFWFAWSPEDWCDVCMPPDEDDTSGAVQDFVEGLLTGAMGGEP